MNRTAAADFPISSSVVLVDANPWTHPSLRLYSAKLNHATWSLGEARCLNYVLLRGLPTSTFSRSAGPTTHALQHALPSSETCVLLSGSNPPSLHLGAVQHPRSFKALIDVRTQAVAVPRLWGPKTRNTKLHSCLPWNPIGAAAVRWMICDSAAEASNSRTTSSQLQFCF